MTRGLDKLKTEVAALAATQTRGHRRPAATDWPDPIEYAISPQYLGVYLYPRQATLLKLWFLRSDLFTAYDDDVIGEWTDAFRATGERGLQPDVLERVRICQSEGRLWFRQFLAVFGRRGGKNRLGAIASAYMLDRLMFAIGNPQAHFEIDPHKRLTAMVFGAKLDQAIAQQWTDIAHVVLNSPRFLPYISRAGTRSLTLLSPHEQRRRYVDTTLDPATFEIVAKESTSAAGRGPAAFLAVFDEAAHSDGVTSAANFEDVYHAAIPALDQFGPYGAIYVPSSPWQRVGLFWELYEQSLETDPSGQPSYPDMLMAQLTSWDVYQDWERTGPGGIRLYPKR